MQKRTKLTTILHPDLARPVECSYDSMTDLFVLDLEDEHEGRDELVVAGAQVLELYQRFYDESEWRTSRGTELSLTYLVKTEKVTAEVIMVVIKPQIQFARLTIEEFLDLSDEDKLSYLYAATKYMLEDDMPVWMHKLLHHVWNGYQELPADLREFAQLMKKRIPDQPVRDILESSLLDNLLAGDELELVSDA